MHCALYMYITYVRLIKSKKVKSLIIYIQVEVNCHFYDCHCVFSYIHHIGDYNCLHVNIFLFFFVKFQGQQF